MIRALVFDFGRVVGLFDHRLSTRRLAQHSPVPADEIHRYLFGGELEDAYESGRIRSAEFVRQVRDRCRLTCDDAFVCQAWADIFWPNPDVCALLPRLKDRYTLLLGSNTNELHSRRFLRQFAETMACFDHIVLSHEIGARKPSAAFFEHCLARAACAPDECVFIDDAPANVAGARACGLHGIVYTGIDPLRADLAALGVYDEQHAARPRGPAEG